MKLTDITEGRVHTIKNPAIKPRSGPELPARAFDAPGTDRSALKKTNSPDFKVIDGWLDFVDWSDPRSDELMRLAPNTLHLNVMAPSDDPKYQGVSVMIDVSDDDMTIPNIENSEIHPNGSTNPEALYQAKHLRSKILKACEAAIRSGKIKGVPSNLMMARDAVK